MELGLYQKQTMNLVMTTELRQAIALLQYSTIDLSRFIQEQALENPLIELEEKPTEIRVDDENDSFWPRPSRSTYDDEEPVNPLEFITKENYDPRDDLLEQVQFLHVDTQEENLLQYLILNLDDNGYLPLTTATIAEQLSISETAVEHGIRLLQQLDPVGVGARNLKECLLLQAQVYYQDEPLVARVINDYLELLGNKKWHKIAKNLDIRLTEVNRIHECIQTLNPKPFANLSNGSPQYIYPDITVEKKNGEYIVSLNDHYLPKIHVNEHYMNLLNKQNNISNYVKENYQKYLWLIKSIEQRRSTILKITKAIIKKQRGFLENGLAHLQPMTLKDIANEIDMHESTISRATNNKIIRTPKGSFEMRHLFTSKLRKSDDNNASSTKVKLLLKKLINEEDKRKPLSDQKIADYFKQQNGITISRRTVAKYREELNILPSSKRKTIV